MIVEVDGQNLGKHVWDHSVNNDTIFLLRRCKHRSKSNWEQERAQWHRKPHDIFRSSRRTQWWEWLRGEQLRGERGTIAYFKILSVVDEGRKICFVALISAHLFWSYTGTWGTGTVLPLATSPGSRLPDFAILLQDSRSEHQECEWSMWSLLIFFNIITPAGNCTTV